MRRARSAVLVIAAARSTPRLGRLARRLLPSLGIFIVCVAAGCRLLVLGVTCEADRNCQQGEECVEGLCGRVPLSDAPLDAGGLQDAGGIQDDGGPPDEEDAGPPPSECRDPADDPAARLVLTEALLIDSADDLAQLEGVLVIDGDLLIGGGEGLAVVDLPDLVEVTGRLRLDELDGVTQPPFTASLPCLSRVGVDLVLDGDVLTSFDLPRLKEVGRRLAVEDGYDEVSLPALVRVGQNLVFEQLLVTDLSGLPLLEEIGGLFVSRNDQLIGLDGLERLTALRLSLRIRNNPKLATLAPLEDVDGVGGVLIVEGNGALPACEAEALRDRLVDGGFRGTAIVEGNADNASCPWFASEPCPPVLGPAGCALEPPDLTLTSDADVAAAAGVTCAANVLIAPGVSDVCLPALVEITGSLMLGDGNSAARVDLPALRSVGTAYGSGASLTVLALPRLATTGAVELFNLPALERLYLPGLQRVTGALLLRDTSLPLVYAPQLSDVVGELEILRVSALPRLDLPNLADVEGTVRVKELPALTTLGSLASLREANGVDVALNAALRDFDGIGLERLFGNVAIDQNPALLSVGGIDATLAFGGDFVTVTNNACLSQEAAQAWADTISPGANAVANNGVAICP